MAKKNSKKNKFAKKKFNQQHMYGERYFLLQKGYIFVKPFVLIDDKDVNRKVRRDLAMVSLLYI